MNEVTLWTVNWNQKNALELLLRSYAMHHYREGRPLHSMIVDNGSTDGSKEWLRERGIPFFDLGKNAGHEWAVNFTYNRIATRIAFLADSDIKLKASVADYLPIISGDCASVGELIDWESYGDHKLMPRVAPWFHLFDIEKLRAAGINRYRGTDTWIYDTGSWFYEQITRAGFTNHRITRNSQSRMGCDYDKFFHYSQVSVDDTKSGAPDGLAERRRAIANEVAAMRDTVPLIGVYSGHSEQWSADRVDEEMAKGWHHVFP